MDGWCKKRTDGTPYRFKVFTFCSTSFMLPALGAPVHRPRDVNMGDLPQRVDAGVAAPSAEHAHLAEAAVAIAPSSAAWIDGSLS